MIKVKFPVKQENIVKELARLEGALQKIQLEHQMIKDMMDAVRDCCKHPKKCEMSDYDGWTYTECKVCGREF